MYSQQLIQQPEVPEIPSEGLTTHEDIQIQQVIREIHMSRSLVHFHRQYVATLDLQLDFLPQQAIQTIQCNICSQFMPSNLFQHFCCETHQFCKRCVLAVIHQNLNNFKIIKCPDAECLAQFSQYSPFYSKLTEYHRRKLIKIRNNRQALSKLNVKLCRKEQCDGMLTTQKLQCSLCNQKHCGLCFQLEHAGKCDKLIKLGLNRKYKFNRCPQCRMMVQRNNGCNHISCICGCQFCYVCGDIFLSSHVCKEKPLGGCVGRIRRSVVNEGDDINKIVNCSKILEFFEPNIYRSTPLRYAQILLAFIFYPLINLLYISLAVSGLTIYLLVVIAIGILFFIVLALLEIIHLQLSPSAFLREKGVPKWLIRILAIPMFPLNLICGVISKFDEVFGNRDIFDKITILTKPLLFFLALPCLLLGEENNSQFE